MGALTALCGRRQVQRPTPQPVSPVLLQATVVQPTPQPTPLRPAVVQGEAGAMTERIGGGGIHVNKRLRPFTPVLVEGGVE